MQGYSKTMRLSIDQERVRFETPQQPLRSDKMIRLMPGIFDHTEHRYRESGLSQHAFRHPILEQCAVDDNDFR